MTSAAPDWAAQVTAISTAVLALGVVGAVAAAVLTAQQVRETRQSRQAQMAAEFLRRWNEQALVEARQLTASFSSPEELAAAFHHYVAENAREAYVLYREPDYFEQLAALERSGAFDFAFIKLLAGPIVVTSWDTYRPALHAMHGDGVYPLFRDLADRMRRALADAEPIGTFRSEPPPAPSTVPPEPAGRTGRSVEN